MTDLKEANISAVQTSPELTWDCPTIESEGPPPKDGKQGWYVVAGSFCAILCSLGATTSFGVFQAYYGNELLANRSPSSIAWIGGLQYFFLFALGLPTTFIQRMGHTRTVVIVGSFLVVIAQLCVSWCDQYYQLIIVQGVIFGFGSGMLMSAASTTVPQWFVRRRHAAMGVIAAGSAVGGALCSALASTLLPLIGFAWSYRVLALLFLCLLIFSCILIRPYPSAPCATQQKLSGILSPLRQPAYLVYVVSASLAGAGVYLPVNYMEEYSKRLQLDAHSLSYLAAIINASSIPGRLLGGYLADILPPHLVLAPSVLICGVLCFAWTSCTTASAVLAFTACFGLSMGVYVALLPSGVAVIRPDDMTISVGLLFTIISLPSLCSPPIFGALISSEAGSASYNHAAIFGGCILLISSAGILYTWWLNQSGPGLIRNT